MNKRFRTGLLILIPVILLALLSQVSLARPEHPIPKEDRMVGYYLLPQELVPSNWGTAEGGWEQSPSDNLYTHPDVGGRMILKAQRDADGEYRFPGPEGRRFFLALEEALVDRQTDTTVRLCSDLAPGEYIYGSSDQGNSYTISGTLYYTAPLAPVQEQCWWPYPVWQMPDGTIYLENSGPHFQGAGRIQKTVTREETRNAAWEETLDITVTFSYVPALDQVVVEQFTSDHQPIANQAVSAQRVREGQSALDLTWAEGAAYALISEQADDGSITYTALTPGAEEAVHTSYFPLDSGLTTPCTITID